MYPVGILLNVVIIVLNAGLAWLVSAPGGQAQVPLDTGLPPPLAADEQREERLIDGMDLGIRQDYRGAIAIFSELIQRYPDYADAYFNRGIARAKLQDYQGAIADQTKAVALNPQLAEAYQARAKLYWQLGQIQRAKADLQTAMDYFQRHHNAPSYHQAQQLLEQWQRP